MTRVFLPFCAVAKIVDAAKMLSVGFSSTGASATFQSDVHQHLGFSCLKERQKKGLKGGLGQMGQTLQD